MHQVHTYFPYANPSNEVQNKANKQKQCKWRKIKTEIEDKHIQYSILPPKSTVTLTLSKTIWI